MLGRGPSPAQQVAALERDIIATREDQRAKQRDLEEAVSAELSALHLLDASRSVQDRLRRQIEERAQAISSLQDEIAALVPKQRKAQNR